MSLVSSLLPTVDLARGLLDDVGLRPFQVFLRTRVWSGNVVGDGTATETDTEITVAGSKRPKVEEKASKDVMASGGAISQTTYEVGPLTPDYGTGGTTSDLIDPPYVLGQEVLFVVKGPGLPDGGVLCRRKDANQSSPFRWMLTLERIGQDA